MKRELTYSLLKWTAIVLLSVTASCSRVSYDYVDDVDNPNNEYVYYTPVLFEFDWDYLTQQGIEIPNTMTVVMSRILHTVHYVYWLDQDGNIIEKPDSGETGSGDETGNGEGENGEGENGEGENGEGENGEGENSEGEVKGTDGSGGTDGSEGTGDNGGSDGSEGSGDNGGADGSEGTGGTDGSEGSGDNGEAEDPGQEPEPENPNICKIDNGEYYIMAIAHGSADYRYSFNGLDGFENSPQMRMTEISATIPNLTKEEITEGNLLDFNPTCPFIHKADPLYFSVEKPEIRLYPESGLTYQTIVLRPGKKTIELTFKIALSYSDDIEIESLTGVISGVPRTIQMMSGIISLEDKKSTGKVAMEMVETETGSHQFVGHVSALGLFPADDANFISGPGIFQVFVKASVMDGEKKVSRLLHAGLNIQSLIKDAHIMLQVDEDEKSGYRCAKNEAEINIPAKLAITRDLILSTSGEGLVEWKDNEGDINLEI